MNDSRISVILPNFNHGCFLKRQLDALVSQSFQPLEIIIIDDASTDDSLTVAEQAAGTYPFLRVLKNEQNKGVYYSLARGISEAKGDYLFFAAANDQVLPDLFSKSMNLLNQHPEAALCSALALEIDEHDMEQGLRQQPMVLPAAGYLSPGDTLKKLYRYNGWFEGCTTIYRRSNFEKIGGFDPRLGSFMDGFLCTALALRHGACFIPEPLACNRIHKDSYSASQTSDVAKALRMFSYAKAQMEGAYKDIFPNNFINLWDRRWRYTIGSNLVKKGDIDREGLMSLIPNHNLLDNLVLSVLEKTGPLRIRLTTFYQLFRLTPRDAISAISWPARKRKPS